MNTYTKYAPNVFVAKCEQQYSKGETIQLQTKHGKEHDCIVFNCLGSKNGFWFYSIVRADGFNVQEWAKKRAEKLEHAASNSDKKSDSYWNASNEGRDFLSLGEPIKIGHHSEKRHRALIERNHNRIGKAIELGEKAESQRERAEYWASKADTINLSMPESIEFFEYKYEEAKARHEGLKDGSIQRDHGFSLTYAKKAVNEIEKNLNLAKRLWA